MQVWIVLPRLNSDKMKETSSEFKKDVFPQSHVHTAVQKTYKPYKVYMYICINKPNEYSED